MNSEDYNQNDRNIVVATATINGGNFTILVLPNLGGISGQLTTTTWQPHRRPDDPVATHRKKTNMKIIKNITQLTLAALLGAAIPSVQAQPEGFDGPPDGGKMPAIPIMSALDVDTNGIIDSNEIANASKELLTLDKNGDGKLSADELKPQFPNGAPPDMPSDFKFPVLPIMKALDTNGDGELDAAEIANAPAALKTLDKNGDGKLTRDEIMPKFPGGFGGPPQE